MELVISYGLHKREIHYKGMQPIAISLTELSVLHQIMMSSIYLEANDIREKMVRLDITVTVEAIRQCISRLKRNIPYWDEIISSDIRGNYAARCRRREVQYKLLCHTSVEYQLW